MDPSGHSGLDIFTPPSKYVHTGDIPVANDSNASYDITKKANTEAACSIINSYINDNQGAFMGVTAGVALVVLTAPASAPVLAVIGAGMAGGAVGMVIGGVLEKGISSADIARTLKTKYNIDVTERQNLDLDSLPSEVKDLCSQYDKNFEDMEGYFETGSVLMGLGVALYEAGYFLDSLQASIAEKSKKAYESLKNWFNKTFKGGSKSGIPSSGLPDWLKARFEAGNNFNKENRPRYPYNEVEVYGDGKNYVVDSYIPGSEIISRKFTQLASVQESTGIGYLNELQKKYPSGAIITDSPFNPKVLRGKTMTGNLILEIPEQKGSIPQSVIDYANGKGIIIRDVNGKEYN